MKLRGPTAIIVVLMMTFLFLIPASETDAAIGTGDVGWTSFEDNEIDINAGSVGRINIVVVNHLPHLSNDLSNDRMVTLVIDAPDHINVSVDKKSFILTGQSRETVSVDLSIWEFEPAGKYTIKIHLDLASPLTGDRASTVPGSIDLNIMSPLSSGDSYNKILGTFENPLPEPFNTPLATAVISFILCLIIGLILLFALIPVIFRFILRTHEDEKEELKHELKLFMPLVMILFAFSNSLRVYGAPEEWIGASENWFSVFYIILGAIIAWRLYLVFIHHTTRKLSSNNRIDQKEMELEPLLKLLGKLVICVMSVGLILSTLGFDLAAIITSAGVVSLGITFGAQNILSQFFSGMVLLITHPFKSGDLVRIGVNGPIYRVKEVRIMNTVFDNWDNEETIIMPNNAVSSATIANLTGEGLIYKVAVFASISYSDDIDLAKKLMVDAAMSHPKIIKDGSVDLPSSRLMLFGDSNIQLRLSAYVYDFNDSGTIGGELREMLFKLFKENDVSMPYPQIDVHLDTGTSDAPKKKK